MKKTKVPPEGGWGWMVVFATGLCNICYVPMMTSFGLLFKDQFETLGLSHTDMSVIMNTNAAFGMLAGLPIGALLKRFGYRRNAIIAGLLITCGVALTSFATSFLEFFIFYGLITSLGMGMCLSAYFLAINSYFVEKRSQATSIAVALTALGSVLMPQLITFLLEIYSSKGVVLIVGGLCSHTILTALLLQPVEWHLKESHGESEELQILSHEKDNLQPVSSSHPSDHEMTQSRYFLNYSNTSELEERSGAVGRNLNNNLELKTSRTTCHGLCSSVVNVFDLALLCDPIFLNIMIGMSLAIFAEMSSVILLPYILSEIGLTLAQNATCLSTLATADIIFRFLAPYLGAKLNKSTRVMYMFSLVLLMISRSGLLVFKNYKELVAVAAALGMSRGIRTVYFTLVIPSYVTLDKFPNASGMQMMINGAICMAGGPIIGLLRDITGSYNICIFLINSLSFSCILLWSIEMIYIKVKNKIPR